MSDLNIAYTEQYVLSCLLNSFNLIDETPNYFISNIGKSLYKSIKEISDKKLEPSFENIILYASKTVSVDKEKLELIKNIKASLKDFSTYVDSLKVAYLKNDLRTKVIKNLVLAVENEEKPISSITTSLDEAYSIINKIENKKSIGIPLNEALEHYKAVILSRSKGEESFPTGIGLIDQHNPLGFHPKYMTTIFGKSGVGKTTVGVSILNAGINRFIPSVYNSLEMDMDILLDKLISNRTGVPFEVLIKGRDEAGDSLAEFLIDLIEGERKKIQNNRRVILADESGQSISDLDYAIPGWKKFMDVDYFVLHLDLATMLQDFGDGKDNTASTYERALNKLHILAKKHNIHIVNYVQSQRDNSSIRIENIEDISKFKPTLGNIKNSSAFEERSRVILGLHRPLYYAQRYLPEDPMTALIDDIMEVQFLKNSMGSLSDLDFYFRGATSKIFPLIKDKIEKPKI